MVKKRSSRGSAANRIKHEEKDVKLPMSTDDVMVVARDRFKGALQGLIVHSDDDSMSSADEQPNSPPPVKVAIKKEPRQQTRRRKKKVVEVDQAFHHTFVMKLFDRSVDLAQFTEETPLYPICRAWMANQPRSNYTNNNDSPKSNSTSESAKKVKVENGSPEVNDLHKMKDVYEMPPPVGPIMSRIPSPEPKELQEITSETFEMNVNRAQLLAEHMQRWTKIHRKWLEAAQANETRYADSGKVLAEMFKNSQKSYL